MNDYVEAVKFFLEQFRFFFNKCSAKLVVARAELQFLSVLVNAIDEARQGQLNNQTFLILKNLANLIEFLLKPTQNFCQGCARQPELI